MLPYAHSEPPHLSEATAHASNNTCSSKLPAHDQLLAEKKVSVKFSPIYEASIHTKIFSHNINLDFRECRHLCNRVYTVQLRHRSKVVPSSDFP
jgi:hypothetical protein